jgi:hypothetical protein
MSSPTVTFTCWRAVVDHERVPDESGGIVLARDHVLIGFFVPFCDLGATFFAGARR